MGGHAVECERCNEEGKMDDETDLKQKHTLTPQFGLIVFATRGMLLATQAMAIIIAAVRYLFELVQQSSVTNAMEPGQAGLAIAVVLYASAPRPIPNARSASVR
jgi:hypothetical protein